MRWAGESFDKNSPAQFESFCAAWRIRGGTLQVEQGDGWKGFEQVRLLDFAAMFTVYQKLSANFMRNAVKQCQCHPVLVSIPGSATFVACMTHAPSRSQKQPSSITHHAVMLCHVCLSEFHLAHSLVFSFHPSMATVAKHDNLKSLC